MKKYCKEIIKSDHKANKCRGCGANLDKCKKLEPYFSYGFLMIQCPICQWENTVMLDGNRIMITIKNVSIAVIEER